MNPRERFFATINYQTPDRPLLAPLDAQNGVWEKLYRYFNIPFELEGDADKIPPRFEGLEPEAHAGFMVKTGEEFRRIGPRYVGPAPKIHEDGSWDGMWGERWKLVSFESGSYAETCYLPFAQIEDAGDLENVSFPSADWFDYSDIKNQCRKHEGYVLLTESSGSGDFINGIAFLRGVEQVLVDIALEDPVYLSIAEKRFRFFYEKIKRTLEAAEGKIDVVRFGEDLGTQLGPIISLEKFTRLFAPKYKKLFDLVHSYGAKTMLHSCGSVRQFIPSLIDIGLDILDVVHVDAAGMNIVDLHRDFYKKIVFCGSISVQTLLPNGTPGEIRKEVALRKDLFSEGGIIIGPTNILQVDMPVENYIAMCEAIGCLNRAGN